MVTRLYQHGLETITYGIKLGIGMEVGTKFIEEGLMGALLIEECYKKPGDKRNLKEIMFDVLEQEGRKRWQLKKKYEGQTAWDILRDNHDSVKVSVLVSDYLYLINNHLIYVSPDGKLNFTADAKNRLDSLN